MITIVTDSSSYFKKTEALEMGIRVVSNNYIVNGQSYSESFSDDNGEFETLLSGNTRCSTSSPNIAAFQNCFEEELQKNNDVLCIVLSSRLSGAYSTASLAMKQTGSKNIVVFDSQLTAGGLYLLIKETKKLINSGLSVDAIFSKLPNIRDRITLAFSVDDMTPLRNSGRIGFVRMSVGTILNIKPILLCSDGAVVSEGVVQGNTELIKSFIEKIDVNTKEVVISHIGDNRLTSNLYHTIKNAFPHIMITMQKIGPVLGIHLGPKVIGISLYIETDAR